MTAPAEFREALSTCPLIAILRGVDPDEVEKIGQALVSAGFTLIEVPLNSPEPFRSIKKLATAFGRHALIGAGTVLNVADVTQVAAVGGRMIISPNADMAVIRASIDLGLASIPGYFTPTEGLAAMTAGAHALKLFPAEAASPKVFKAHSAVMPKATPRLVVGGVTPENMTPWIEAGASGFGLGSALYQPGDDPHIVRQRAESFVKGWRGRPS